MTVKKCIECGTPIYGGVQYVYCNVCLQAIENRKINARQTRDDNFQAEMMKLENERIAAKHRAELVAAENARIKAEKARIEVINHQNDLILEMAVNPTEIYKYGFDYIDTELGNGNLLNMQFSLEESGFLAASYTLPFATPALNDAFNNGLTARLGNFENMFSILKSCAWNAGKLHAEKTMSGPFTLTPNLKVGGLDVATQAFNSFFKTKLEEDTGRLKMSWTSPFSNEELNQAFEDGIKEAKVNSEDKMAYRLRFEVPELKAARIISSQKKRRKAFYRFGAFVLKFMLLAIFSMSVMYGLWYLISG